MRASIGFGDSGVSKANNGMVPSALLGSPEARMRRTCTVQPAAEPRRGIVEHRLCQCVLGGLLVVAVGCVESSPSADRIDDEVLCGAGPLELLIGESVSGELVPMDELTEPTLVHGPQGGHHLNLWNVKSPYGRIDQQETVQTHTSTSHFSSQQGGKDGHQTENHG